MRKIFTILLLVMSLSLIAKSDQYLIRTFTDENGKQIDERITPVKKPDKLQPAIKIPPNSKASLTLSNVPAFDWCYGCSATSAAMMAGHYDNTIFPDMYTGPAYSGVVPMNNSTWGSGECPLSATHMTYDGLGARGHVDDYWVSTNSTANDPYITGSWTAHANANCTGDYMGTNQSALGNIDGSTTFYYYTDGSPIYDYTLCEPSAKDGCHGLRQFFESRGYSVVTNYSQYIDAQGLTYGFTFAQFKTEINAGRPVLIQLDGHTMLGYGYNDTGNTVYIHDTWDHNNHSMTWGGSYGGMAHVGVTVISLTTPSISVTSPNGTENWYLSSTHNITWTSQNVNNVDIALYNSGSPVISIATNYTASLGSISWPIPGGLAPSPNYKIRVSISNATSTYDESDANFTISQAPSITIFTPNGGENWLLGSQQMINWTSTNTGSNVNIDLYSGGAFHSSIASGVSDIGNYPWNITTSTIAGNLYTVRIEDASDPTTYDYSNGFFTIQNPPGYGQDNNSGNPSLPVTIDVEDVDIDGQMVNPDVTIDPAGSVSLYAEINVTDSAVHTVQNPSQVLLSYSIDLTGSTSGVTMSTTLDFTGLASMPSYIHFWNGGWVVPSNVSWGGNDVSCDFTLTTKDGSTEIILSQDNPLPVSLSTFNAVYSNHASLLEWTTQSELNNSHWNVYRGESENYGQAVISNAEPITGAGTTFEPTDYQYYDPDEVEANKTYWYWIENIDFSGQNQLYGPASILIPEDHQTSNPPEIPTKYGLYANYPNPFNPNTQISFALHEASNVDLIIYDAKGRKIKKLLMGENIPADQIIRIDWNGTDEYQKEVASGVYLYRLITKNKEYTKKMMMIK